MADEELLPAKKAKAKKLSPKGKKKVIYKNTGRTHGPGRGQNRRGHPGITVIPKIPENEENWKELSLDKLEAICEIGATREDICAVFHISADTLTKLKNRHPEMKEIMDNAYSRGRLSARRKLWQQAMKGDTACLIFLNKNVNGMSDKGLLEVSGPDGKPIQTQDVTPILGTLDGFLQMIAKAKRESTEFIQGPVIEARAIPALGQADSVRSEAEVAGAGETETDSAE